MVQHFLCLRFVQHFMAAAQYATYDNKEVLIKQMYFQNFYRQREVLNGVKYIEKGRMNTWN